MRRAPAAGGALALVLLAVWLAPGASSVASPPASSSADCVPVQHSKRVTKRVKVRKNGRIVKVKRKKTVRWETCEQQPSAPVGPTSLAPCSQPSTNVGVTAFDVGEVKYSLTRGCVNAGTVHVELVNRGEDPHHVFLRPSGTPTGTPATYKVPDTPPFELEGWDQVSPQQPVAGSDITLSQGDWYLWCDLLTHEEQGMYATLQVR